MESTPGSKVPKVHHLDPPPGACYNCWQPGHFLRHCPRPVVGTYCSRCGRRGVTITECPRECGRPRAPIVKRHMSKEGETMGQRAGLVEKRNKLQPIGLLSSAAKRRLRLKRSIKAMMQSRMQAASEGELGIPLSSAPSSSTAPSIQLASCNRRLMENRQQAEAASLSSGMKLEAVKTAAKEEAECEVGQMKVEAVDKERIHHKEPTPSLPRNECEITATGGGKCQSSRTTVDTSIRDMEEVNLVLRLMEKLRDNPEAMCEETLTTLLCF